VRNGLVVRASSILRSPEGPYVLVVSDDRRTLTKRPVEVGNVLAGYAAITGGLRQNELVAAKRVFFLDAERRRGGGAGP
jgi:multidrug efflux pump subunit AcrA (membrane-fusion protein)